MDLKNYIRSIKDFPKPGINFIDITTLIIEPESFRESVDLLVKSAENLGITKVAAIDSRGFIFGAAAAYILNVGFVPIRKKGKLPYKTISESYTLEYGTNTIEIHTDAFEKGDKVFLIDDLLATGGTIEAACKLIEKSGAEIKKIGFVVELSFLDGRKKITGYDVISLVTY